MNVVDMMLLGSIPFNVIVSAVALNAVIIALILIFALHRGRIEADRRRELMQINHELATAVQEAQRANRLKSEFLATMSHELRTPLNSMIGYGQLLLLGLSGDLDEDVLYQISRIQANSKRLLAMINDILDISRIEAKRLEINHEPFAVRQLVKELLSAAKSMGDDKKLNFSVMVHENVPTEIVADVELVRRIAINLLSNAHKFTHDGSICLEVGISDAASEWYIRVTDTGIGIAPEAIGMIFDRFRQVDGSFQRAQGGAGLGLAIVKQYTAEMGGHIEVSSDPGRGSMFTVYLPLIEVPEGALVMA